MPSSHIVVAGDAPVHLLVYPPLHGQTHGIEQHNLQKLHTHRYRGGAMLIGEFLCVALPEPKHQIHVPALKMLEDVPLENSARSIIELDLHSAATQATPSFKLKRTQQLNTQPLWYCPDPPLPRSGNFGLLILQDVEGYFNNGPSAIEFFRDCRPRLLLYHMARPLCCGDVWETVRRGPYVQDGKQDPENIVVVVSADDLRAEGIQLSRGLSWEKACQDFVEQLGSVGRLLSLATCAHLIVLFGCDGVIYHRGLQASRPTLFFDSGCAEGEFVRKNMGYFPGLTEAFVAGLASKLSESETGVEEGIEFGLCAARRLAKIGLIQSANFPKVPVYPVSTVMRNLCPAENVLRFSIPSDEIGSGVSCNWSILDHTIGDPAETARQIVRTGISTTRSQIPLAQFGSLVLVDRQEIESFRALFNFVREYLEVSQTKPLSIALFGPKGSGKSFAAMQVAETASGEQIVQKFRFDLGQFRSVDDLVVAIQSVRDCSLEGRLPLVYVNGFDTRLSGTSLYWLPHLLPIMLHGRFFDHGESRPVGAAVFLLGATTFRSYEDFQRRAAEGSETLAGAEDFLGCLGGFVNMLGPDCVDDDDRLYPVRRAVILRTLLEEREPNLKLEEEISIDESVVDGLLMVPTYRRGVRSLISIISMSRLNGCCHFERAALPPEAQLHLHVEYGTFMKYMSGRILPESVRELLAERLHGVYLQQRLKMASTNSEDLEPKDQQWSQLGEELKESARAHADDIPRKLRMISCFLAQIQEHRTPVTKFDKEELEMLAKSEHERWSAERLQKQWRLGERDIAVRKSPFLIPWDDLLPEWQDVDRAMVESYPSILPPDFKIYRIRKTKSSNSC